jgi:SAM-dependent methyltransferase
MNPLHLAEMVLRGLIPFQAQIRQIKRKFYPYTDDIGDSYYSIENAIQMINMLKRQNLDIARAHIIEFGTGWLPIVPMVFCVAGAENIKLTDIEHLMDNHTIYVAKKRLIEREQEICDGLDIKADLMRERMGRFSPEYVVPWNPGNEQSDSVDLIISRTVFEHVPIDDLLVFIKEFYRIMRRGAYMCHLIDNSDHWQHRQRDLSRVNFLKYDENDIIWKLAQFNTQCYQNRLRHSDYKKIFQEHHFEICAEQAIPDHKSIEDIKKMKIDQRFSGKTNEDMGVLTSIFVCRK